MTWVRVDDKTLGHPKLLAAGPHGVALWLAGLCHANAHHTDGLIEKLVLRALFPSEKWSAKEQKGAAELLVAIGLWHDEGDAWRIHNYERYQQEAMSNVAAERREYERAKKANQRAAKRNAAKNEHLSGLSPGDSPGHVPGTPGGTDEGQASGTGEGQIRPAQRDTRDLQIGGVPAPRPGPPRPVPKTTLVGHPSGETGELDLTSPTTDEPSPAKAAPKAKKPLHPREQQIRDLAALAKRTAEEAYRTAKEPFPGGSLAWNAHEWRSIAEWALSASQAALSARRVYDPADVLRATVAASVRREPRKPVGWWKAKLSETWAEIRNDRSIIAWTMVDVTAEAPS